MGEGWASPMCVGGRLILMVSVVEGVPYGVTVRESGNPCGVCGGLGTLLGVGQWAIAEPWPAVLPCL